MSPTMKKILLISALAAVLSSCTYNSEYGKSRTPENLTGLATAIANSSVFAAATVLSDIDKNYKDTILTAGFDTLVTSEAYFNRFGTNCTEMQIQASTDSAWTFISTGTGSLSFVGNLKMTGRSSSDKTARFCADITALYDEENGFTAELTSSKLDFVWGNVPVYYESIGFFNQYTLLVYGDAIISTYKNFELLDNLTVHYKGSEYDY